MNYKDCLKKLYSLQKFGIKFGLNSTENLLAELDAPHLGLPVLHVAGTNGKGSTAAAVTSVLTEAGYRVGLYTSPHLVSFRERFVIGREMISEDDTVRLAESVWRVCRPEEPPTFFEFVTVMAFLHFAQAEVDLAVLETGMGGRLDATNAAPRPLCGVITNISVEHTEFLGGRLRQIALEKAGVIKPGMTVVTGEERPRVRRVFEDRCREMGGRLLALGREFRRRRTPAGGFNYYGLRRRLQNLEVGLAGDYQRRNAALALAALEVLAEKGFDWDEDAVRRGLAGVSWPGRGQVFSGPPRLMLDGAHNPAAAKSLARLLEQDDHRRLHLVLGVMADKDVAAVIRPLLPAAGALYLTRPQYHRAADPEVLAAAASGFPGEKLLCPDIPAALAAARRAAGPDDLIVVTGSLFTVGEALACLEGRSPD